MNTTLDFELGHFDRVEALEHLLENHAPSEPETATIDEYLSWTPKKRLEFNDRRSLRIADSIVVETPSMQQLIKQCRLAARFSHRDVGRTGVLLSGKATAGKTTAAIRAMVDGFHRHTARYPEWRDLKHHPVVYVEVPTGCNGKKLMGRFLYFFGQPVLDRMTLEERTQRVTELLQDHRTSLIVIDEMQNLAGVASTGRWESAQAIKNLLNSVKAVPLYVGMNLDRSSLTTGDLGAQLAGRSTLVQLGKMEIRTEEGQRLWIAVIDSFEKQLGLMNHPERTLRPLARYLHTRTRGYIRGLSRLLTVAALELIDNDDPHSETITKELLAGIQLDLTTERKVDLAEAIETEQGARRAA
ncbi:ATP-binding protein [Microbacterium sp. NPDC087665]|uniref:ATP-binding protein n=1 Tax=Microbacterium sp. NPDC087665 TaxID=3364194 RepID=UPI0037F256D3